MNWLLALGVCLLAAAMILGCASDDGNDGAADSDVGAACKEFCRVLYEECDAPMETADGGSLSADECGFGCEYGGYADCAATVIAAYDESGDCAALAASFADCANGQAGQ